MANYRLGTFSNSPGYQLVFQARDGGGWWLLASVATSEEGAKLAYAIQALLVDINQRCEGMHIVEHVLLGPLQAENCQSDDRIGTDSSFAKNRLSVVLPNWTRRTADPSFQSLAEQLVYENSPAHVSANVFWLDFTEMYRFEGLYMAWLKERRLRPEGSDELDDIAEELAVFLVTRESSMIRRDGERAYA
jgi:hypothetical protein